MAQEAGYHKLKNIADADSVLSGAINPSMPAERHWLGEGVYFFLNPNGFDWAVKWPFKPPRAGSSEGIIVAYIDTEGAMDFRVEKMMATFRNLVNFFKPVIIRKYKQYSDGAALAMLYQIGKLKRPTCVIANFDREYEGLCVNGSRIILIPQYKPLPYSETTQIQACVIDQRIIAKKELFSAMSAV